MKNLVLRLLLIFFAFFTTESMAFGQSKAIAKRAVRAAAKSGMIKVEKQAAKSALKTTARKGLVYGEKEALNPVLKQSSKKIAGQKLSDAMARENYKSVAKFSSASTIKKMNSRAIPKLRASSAVATKGSLVGKATAKRYKKPKAVVINLDDFIKTRHQYITSDGFKRFMIGRNAEKLKLGRPKDAIILRDNMSHAMGKYYSTAVVKNSAAHHIVGDHPLMVDARAKFAEFGIDINSPINGIFLPKNPTSRLKGPLHAGGHTNNYYRYVNDRIAKTMSKEECFKELDLIKRDLFYGKLQIGNISN